LTKIVIKFEVKFDVLNL